MKICFVAPASNYHTRKWCEWFSAKGHEVHVISFIDAQIEGAQVHWLDSGASAGSSDGQKMKYLLKAGSLRRLVKKIAPDVINVHYASSYGAVAALAGLRGYALSVWGSDIYDFPNRSPLHRALLQFALAGAKYPFSTSRAMAGEAGKYTKKKFDITPFGVDMTLFNRDKRNRAENDGRFVVGTVKALKPVYCIDGLLRAAAKVREMRPDIPLEVRIAGSGDCEAEYRALAKELGIDGITRWLGFISQSEVAVEWANMDVGVIFSLMESFGVSAVEAQACETPVIVSDAPGLMEATKPGETSVVVPRRDVDALAAAIIELYDSPEKRGTLGRRGRTFVAGEYEIDACFERIEGLFDRMIARK